VALNCEVPFGLDVAAEICGPDLSFVKHIMAATNAKIMVCGPGAPTHQDAAGGLTVYLGASELAHVRNAVDLIQDLLRAVREKCQSFVPTYSDAMKMGTDTGVQFGRRVAKPLTDRAWKTHLDSMNHLTVLMQEHEKELVEGRLEMKYLLSSAKVFSHFQEVCRQSAEREAEMDRRLVSMQAHVATILPTIVQQSMQEGMTPPQSMKFALSIVDVVNDIPQPPQPLQQPPPRARPLPMAPAAFEMDRRARPPQPVAPPPSYPQNGVAGGGALGGGPPGAGGYGAAAPQGGGGYGGGGPPAYKRGREEEVAHSSWQPRGGARHGYGARGR